jgi:hypothetical protein
MTQTGKIVEVMFENAIETYEHQEMLLGLTDFWTPESGMMQNSGNFVWRPVQQHAPIITGWDLTGQETGIIEETYPAVLGEPENDFVKQRADDLRDMSFWKKRGKESGRQQATQLNKALANAMTTQGSLFYRSNVTSGWDFITEGQVIMNERQGYHTDRHFLFNDRTMQKYGSDLAARQTLQGRPEEVWKKGQITQNTAEFDVHTGSFLPNLIGGASPNTTVTGDQSFAPEGGTVDQATGQCTNIDYRSATIPVADSSGYNIGDKIQFENGGTPVESVALADKTETGHPMTFTVVAKPNGTSITVYPKPIAVDDPGLTLLEQAYANVNTRILNTAVVVRLNVAASEKANLFWFDGMKVESVRMSNGQTMYMVYDGKIEDMTFRYRLFTWYGITIKDPSRVGVATSFT